MRTRSINLRLIALATAVLTSSNARSATDDLMSMSFESLARVEVVTAASQAREINDALTAKTVVTSEDIRAYGYTTLAQIINSMRGLYTTTDMAYEFPGGRGSGVPGEYASRFMLRIDGYSSADNLYNQIFLEESGLLDAELIERVEFIPGAGSVSYGNNALMGTFNVITKMGAEFNAAEVAADVFTGAGKKLRATYGKKLENGYDMLLSVSALDAAGQDYYMPAYDSPAFNNGIAQNLDSTNGHRLFAKLGDDKVSLSMAFSNRRRMWPTNSYSPDASNFNTPAVANDESAFINLRLSDSLNSDLKYSTSAYVGHYMFDYSYQFVNDDGLMDNYTNDSVGNWVGLDHKFVYTGAKDHALIVGTELRQDYFSNIHNYYTKDQRHIVSAYVQDDYRLSPSLTLNMGVRYDRASDVPDGDVSPLSPRIGLIYKTGSDWTLKSSYGTSFRLPVIAETDAAGVYVKPEVLTATEISAEKAIGTHATFLATAYNYAIKNRITYDWNSGYSFNVDSARIDGVEFEYAHQWQSATRLRTSVAFQSAADINGAPPVNIPSVIAKLNATTPIPALSAAVGFETQYLGPRYTVDQRELTGTAVSNLTLTNIANKKGLSWSFSIKNLFDNPYEIPSAVVYTPADHNAVVKQDTLAMRGRHYWLQVSSKF
jgi:outer membrane receptor protein involved in Fe transport